MSTEEQYRLAKEHNEEHDSDRKGCPFCDYENHYSFIPSKFTDRVLYLRRTLRISQEQLAAELNISFATVNRWESGKVKPQRAAKAAFDELWVRTIVNGESLAGLRIRRGTHRSDVIGDETEPEVEKRISLRETIFIDGRSIPLIPWDVDFDWTKAARERMMNALVVCRCKLTDLCWLGGGNEPHSRSTVMLRVFIPEGFETKFDEVARPYRRAKPPKARLN